MKVTVARGSTITLPAPTRDGYKFDYWEGSKYHAGDTFKADEDHTFVAQWVAAGKSGGSAKTGDESNLSFWLTMAVVSALGFLGLRKKINR